MMNDHENNLFATLAFGELSEVQALLKKGINLDEHKNARGETALHHTLFTGYMDRTKLLLEHNASPNIKDNYGQTILHKLI
ncbi:ankyrin repeat domain-containing protein [Candidatus Rickettsia tasmanensis]